MYTATDAELGGKFRASKEEASRIYRERQAMRNGR